MNSESLTLCGEELADFLRQTPAEHLRTLEQHLLEGWQACGNEPCAVLRDLSDEALAAAYQKGLFVNLVFQELFWLRARRWFARWFFSWGVRPEESLELSAQLFLKFWENRLRSYRPEQSLQAYLRRSARNLLAEKWRRPLPTGLGEGEWPTKGWGPGEEAIGKEAKERVEQALKKMRNDRREVFRLIVEEGHNSEQVAQLRGWTRSRVSRLLFEARREIERTLGEAEG